MWEIYISCWIVDPGPRNQETQILYGKCFKTSDYTEAQHCTFQVTKALSITKRGISCCENLSQ